MTTIVQSQPWPRTDDAIRALLDSGEPAVLHSLLADHAERLLVWALGGATVKAARLAKMIPVIVLHCIKGHHEDKVEEEPAKPRKPRKSTFQQLPR